jgi:hemoglobin/transferrin/lactoferrin receptor protein
MPIKQSLLALAIATSLPSHLVAAEADDTTTLGTVEVTAQRVEKKSYSQNVTTISSKQLEDELAQSMEDAIRYIPGVNVVDIGRFGDNGFNIRGLEGDQVAMTIDGLSMAEEVDTAINYEFFRAGRGGIDIDALKSIEIVKGADAITAGSGALSGAVMFTTKDPYDYLKTQGNDTHVGVKYGYTGSSDQNMGTLTFANRTGIVESMLVYTERDGHETESWYDTTNAQYGSQRRTPDPIDAESENLLAKIDLVPNAAHRFGVVYERGRSTNDIDNWSRTDGTGSYYRRTAHDTNDRDRYGLRYIWQAGNFLFDTMEWAADRQETESRGQTDILVASGRNSTTTTCSVTALCPRQENRATMQTLDRTALDFEKSIERGSVLHALAYGLAWQKREIDYEAHDYRWDNTGAFVSDTTDAAEVPKTDATNWNIYLRDRIRLFDERLTLTIGARYDSYEYEPTLSDTFSDSTGSVTDADFSAPTWQLGADFRLTQQHSVWAQVGRGFRAPTASDMYASTSTQQVTISGSSETVTAPSSIRNPDLEAEESLNLEAGYRWQTDSVRFGLSIFRDKYDNFIESASLTGSACSTSGSCADYTYSMPVNRGEVTVRGFEAEGLWRVSDDWTGRMAFTYNHGEKGDGTPLASIAPAKLVLGMNYAAPSQRWNITGNITHQVAKEERNAGESDTGYGETESAFLDYASEYTVFDLFGSYNVTPNLRVSAGVYNLFDKRYWLWSRVRNLSEGTMVFSGNVSGEGIGRYSEPGRNMRVTVAYTF